MAVSEATLKGELVKRARADLPGFVILRHEDHYTHGIPDISIHGNGLGSWTEVKYANPDFQSKGIQELTMLRLAVASFAWYTVYYQKDDVKRTYIVEPNRIGQKIIDWEVYTDGFNHQWVIDHIRRVHNVNNYRS